MIAKTPNIRCFVAKTHLSQFTRFFRQQMSPFYPFRGGVAKRGQFHLFLPFFLLRGFPKPNILKFTDLSSKSTWNNEATFVALIFYFFCHYIKICLWLETSKSLLHIFSFYKKFYYIWAKLSLVLDTSVTHFVLHSLNQYTDETKQCMPVQINTGAKICSTIYFWYAVWFFELSSD